MLVERELVFTIKTENVEVLVKTNPVLMKMDM